MYTSPQVSGSDTEPLQGNQTRAHQYNASMALRKANLKSRKLPSTQQPTTVEMITLPLPKLQIHGLKRDS